MNLFSIVLGDVKTTFLSGSKFNVSWHLAYPHRVSTGGKFSGDIFCRLNK